LHKGALELEMEVLKKGLCTSCGGCIGICPYIHVRKENVVVFEQCGMKEGRCYELCPRTRLDLDALNQEVFGKERDDFLLGTHKAIYMAQSARAGIQKKAQYGGVVTGLLTYALEKKLIDGAVLVNYSTDYSLLPEPVLVRTKEEILACAGSKYTAAPSLQILSESVKKCKKLAYVGRACQIEALRKRIKIEPEIGERIALIVGLFCMWALNFKKLYAHLVEKIDVSKARGFDIPYNRFVVYTEKKSVELEFEPIKGFRRSTCDVCYDFTSELADLSVGSTEWKDDWNTLITRTERGQKLADRAAKDKALRVKEFPGERVNLLRDAVLGKKKRVLKAIFEDKACPEYLAVSDSEKKWIMEAKPVSGVKK
jgi:coenzyme F420 hydrogenase subunit beta